MRIKIALSFLFFFAIFFIPNNFEKVNAALIGGDDYSNAVGLSEGTTVLGSFQVDTSSYYFINVMSGYEVKLDYSFIGDFVGDITLFDINEQELAGWDEETGTIRWLNSGDDTSANKIYIVISNYFDVVDCELTVSFIDRQDAGTGKDAGGDFESAIPVSYGEYTGNISSFVNGNEGGNDIDDFYQLNVKENETVTIKITPEGKMLLG